MSGTTLANWRTAPYNVWSFSNAREMLPTARIRKAAKPVSLEIEMADMSGVRIKADTGDLGLQEFYARTNTDSVVVLKNGRIVHEYYSDADLVDQPHILMSVSKSVLGLIAGILESHNLIDIGRTVESYLPDLASTAYKGATLRDLLDMRAGVWFVEDYTALDGLIIEYRKAQGWNPYEVGETPSDLRSYYQLMDRTNDSHNGRFLYASPNTDLLALVFEVATGKPFAALVQDFLWQPMGAASDAYITLDRFGAPRAAGGFCATARDLALVGHTLLNNGRNGETEVIPGGWIEDMWDATTQEAWAEGDFAQYYPGRTMHYRSKWYASRGAENMIFGLGVNGQNIFVDRDRDVVIVKFSSQAEAIDLDVIALTMQGIDAIRAELT